MSIIPTPEVFPTAHIRTSTTWTIALKELRVSLPAPLPDIPLGHLVHLEDGEAYRAPFITMLFGRSRAWWWRPTWHAALAKGHKEARR